jgi:hypothetical protein
VDNIPVDKNTMQTMVELQGNSDAVVEIDFNKSYDIEDEDWKFSHVINTPWSAYFGQFHALFNSCRPKLTRASVSDSLIERVTAIVCGIFGEVTT